MNRENEEVEAKQLDEPPRVPRLGRRKTREPRSYRDKYDGRGKYAKENHEMIDREQVRLNAWQDESTSYSPKNMALFFIVAAVLSAASVLAAVCYFAFGN
jgi:hypothetical protein